MTDLNLTVNADRLVGELNELALFSDAPAPAVTRVVYTKPDQEARVWLKGKFEEAGLTIREDPIGNTFARWVGSEPDLPAIGTGSHIDAIPHSGMYDGTVGVLGGLEAIRALQEAGFQPRRSIEVLLFCAEEPTRYGLGCFGSRALGGLLDKNALLQLKDNDGAGIEESRAAAGFTGDLDKVALPKDYYRAFVELHIEQGPILEAEGIDIGIVTSIAAPSSFRITIEGAGGHAGAVLMPARRDALCAASEIILAVEQAAKESASDDTVATVGTVAVHPGAINSIPSRVVLEVDLRDTNIETRDAAFQKIKDAANNASVERNVSVEFETINADPPATCASEIVESVEASSNQIGASSQRMISRAYHDSLFMAQVAPTGMIFIPCYKGYSHRPDEYSSPEDIARGVNVLALSLAHLSLI